MRIEAQAMRLALQVRGSPKVKGQLLQFVRKRTKRVKQRKLQQIMAYGQSFVQYYTKSY